MVLARTLQPNIEEYRLFAPVHVRDERHQPVLFNELIQERAQNDLLVRGPRYLRSFLGFFIVASRFGCGLSLAVRHDSHQPSVVLVDDLGIVQVELGGELVELFPSGADEKLALVVALSRERAQHENGWAPLLASALPVPALVVQHPGLLVVLDVHVRRNRFDARGDEGAGVVTRGWERQDVDLRDDFTRLFPVFSAEDDVLDAVLAGQE